MVANRMVSMLGRIDLTNVNTILDIGSWHLKQSIELATIFPEAIINAFEPVPSSFKLCQENHSALDKETKNRIHLNNIALSDSQGEIPFYQIEKGVSANVDEGFSSMLKFSDNELKGITQSLQTEIKVQSETLDNWCKENSVDSVDIIWMDAQGAELLVLKGAEEILKHTRIIMTEVGLKAYYEGHTLKTDIDAFLSKLGFKELESSYEVNIAGYEANIIYIKEQPQN